MRRVPDLSVYAVSDPSARIGVIEAAEAAARGGATLIQLRDKDASDADFADLARSLLVRLAPLKTPLIINDRVEIAKAIGCAGAHVGQSDAAARDARAQLGPEAIIGLSVETPAQLDAVPWEAIDYLGVGPVRATPTKPGYAEPLGFDGLAAICAAARRPTVAIGGVKAEDAGAIKAAGADGMAVVSAIFAAEHPESATRSLVDAWRSA